MPPASSTGGRSSSLLLLLPPSRRLVLLVLMVNADKTVVLLLLVVESGRRGFVFAVRLSRFNQAVLTNQPKTQHDTTDKPAACHQYQALCSLPPSSSRTAQRQATLDAFLALLPSSASGGNEGAVMMHSLVRVYTRLVIRPIRNTVQNSNDTPTINARNRW